MDKEGTVEDDHDDVRVNRVALARPSLAGLDLGNSLDLRRQSEVTSREELKKLSINQSLADGKCTLGPKSTAYKNLFGLALSYLAVFGAYLGIQALQSSLNQEANLGLTSLCVLNGCFMLSTLITPTIIRLAGTKYSLIGGYVVFLLYTISNAYPSWYTLIPSSFLLGIAFGPVWASLNTHATNVAIKYATVFNQKAQHLIILFSGVVAFHIQLAQASGNLISSVVIISCSDTSNTTTMTNATNITLPSCDSSEFCTNTSALNLDRVCLYVLLAVYATMDLVGIGIASVMLDRVKTDTHFFSSSQIWKIYIKEPVLEIFRVSISWKMLLLIPPTLFNGMELAFVAGRFSRVSSSYHVQHVILMSSQVFVSDCVGVQWVGFSSMVYGLGSAVGAISSGFIVKWVPEHFIILVGYTNNIALTLFLLFWERMPSFVNVFVFPIFWGMSDGLWNTLIPGTTPSHITI